MLPPSAAPFALPPNDSRWLQIASEITSLIGQACFTFSHHSTKPRPERKDDQLTLVFDQVGHFDTAAAFFNVDVTYQRNSKKHQKGGRRLAGQFTPARHSSLVKLYRRLGLALPKRLSLFHQALPKLRGRLFVAQLRVNMGDTRLDKSSLQLLNLSADELESLLNTEPLQKPNKGVTVEQQLANNARRQAFSASPVTTAASAGFKYRQNLVQTTSNQQQVTINPPQQQTTPTPYKEQSVDEWLEEYTGANHSSRQDKASPKFTTSPHPT